MTEQTLERRITAILSANSGSTEISELVAEVENAIIAAADVAEQRRADQVDLMVATDAKLAHQAFVETELARDRLRAVLPKICAQLSRSLQIEAAERWLVDFRCVEQRRDEAVAEFQHYPELANQIAAMFSLAETVDREVSRINGSAPDGVHNRLRPVELTARDMQQFTRDCPSLAASVELSDWTNSGRKLWPVKSNGSFAASFASSMVMPPHPASNWGAPDVQAQRREAIEAEQTRIARHMADATKQQEDRINAEARERAVAMRARVDIRSAPGASA